MHRFKATTFTFFFVFFLIIFSPFNVYGENAFLSNDNKITIIKNKSDYTIQGKTFDSKTGEIIPFCSITILNSFIGTSSNELGEFEIKVKTIPATLIFTHINYEKQTITIKDKFELTIKLKPLVFELNEVTISNKKDFYAYELAKKVFRKTDIDRKKRKFGKAYYRQKSKNGKQYSEFSEIIYDINHSSEGIHEWDILEGRYALKGGMVNNRNYTLLSRVLKSFQQNSEDLIFPFRDNIDYFYNVKVIEKTITKEGPIVLLDFKPYSKIKSPILEAEAYVNSKTNELLKITATLKHDDFAAVKLKEKSASKKNYILTYEMAFKKDSVYGLVMDYMKVNQEFDYYKKDSLITHVSSSSNLSFFEYYKPNSRRRFGRQFSNNKSDWQKLNAIGYNKGFWEENAIVKRTPIENDIIKSFEKNNAFESIFFNTREQIALTQSNISDDIFIKNLEENIRNYNSYKPVEKVYLHTDKDLVTGNENLWFSAYVTLGTRNHYSFASKVLYVDLINPEGKIIKNISIPLEEGRGKGSLKIPKKINSGTYQLRAYTQWMQNLEDAFFFNKNIKIVNKETKSKKNNSSKIDLQFFPESGTFISGLNGRIAFKAIGIDGLGKKVKGKIVDSNNKFISNFKSIEHGAGVINFIPKLGESYTAILDNNTKFKLPNPEKTGYSMLVSNINLKNIKVKIQATENLRGKKFYIIGHIHNEKYYQGKFEFGGKLLVNFEIPKKKLPTGVFKLTLFNEKGIPMAERAVFNNSKNELKISATIDRKKSKANRVKVDVLVNDSKNWPVSTGISLAVTDADKFSKNKNSSTILSQFLLESDLKGYIENPTLFFNDNKRSTRYRLELVMLTHGWRKINWRKIKDDTYLKFNSHKFQQGLKITGIASKSGKPLTFKKIKMVAITNNEYATYTGNTNGKGEFTINNFNIIGSTKINFNEINPNGKLSEIDVAINPIESSKKVLSNFRSLNNQISEEDIKYAKLTSLNLINDSLLKDRTLLNEVKIKSAKKYLKKDVSNFDRDNKVGYNMVPDHTIHSKEIIGGENMLDVLNAIPGLHFKQNRIHIRQNPNPALWIIDGIEVLELPYNYDFGNIEKIEVLKSVISTAIYGPRGANGVILFKTKTAKMNDSKVNFVPKQKINGHSEYTEFYSPKFQVNLNKPYKEFKTTLYWNPLLITNEEGKATFYFDKPKNLKNIQIVIEGLSKYGNPGFLIKDLEEKQN